MSDFIPRSGELFSITKQFNPPAETGQNVIVTGGDNGGVESALPVIDTLLERGVRVNALFVDAGLTTFTSQRYQLGLQVSPLDTLDKTTLQPDAILFTPSVKGQAEEHVASRFEAPSVVIEDFPESSRVVIELAKRTGIEPPTVCVIDEQAKRMIKQRFPDVSVSIEVTGPSAFSRLASEKVALRAEQVKQELEIAEKKLVVFQLPSLGHTQLALEIADACNEIRQDVVFAMRQHPNDTIEYERIFEKMRLVDTSAYTSENISVAADIIIAQRSTCSLLAAIRQQPNVALDRFVLPGFVMPLVESGASLRAAPFELPGLIDELLEAKSERYKTHIARMEQYKIDGKEAARIADVVCRAMVSRNK